MRTHVIRLIHWLKGHQTAVIVAVLVAVGFGLYAPSVNNPLFWDDVDWIVDNPCVHAPFENFSCLVGHDVLAGIERVSNYYRPFLMFTFAANWAMGREAPWGYHLISNGLHIANAVLLFFLLYRLFSVSSVVRAGSAKLVGVFAALFWLIHPLQTESVAYISGRGDPLSVTLMLGAMLLWLRALNDSRRAQRSWLRAGALLCAVCAILSRETAVLFPAYLMVTLMAFPKVVSRSNEGSLPQEEKPQTEHSEEESDGFWRSALLAFRAVWPFIAVSGVYAILRLTVLNFANTLNWYATANVYTENIEVRVWTFMQVLWEYARLIVAPIGLHMERSVPILTAPWQYPAFLGIAVVGVAAWAVVRHWKRGNRLWFWAAMMFIIPLAPSSGIAAPINSLIYEHWLYLSIIGPALLMAVYGERLFAWLRGRSRMLGIVFLIVVAGYAVFFSVQTVRRTIIWGDTERFYQQILSYEPSNVRVLNNLANLYAKRGELQRTEEYLVKAIEASPEQPAPYHNLANLYRDQGAIERALELYAQAVYVDPLFYYSYRNAAAMLLDVGDLQKAYGVLTAWQEAIPAEPATYLLMAQLTAKGYPDIATEQLTRGLPYAQGTPLEAQYRAMIDELSAN